MLRHAGPAYFFLHVPKTGGTTLDRVLVRSFRSRRRWAVASMLEHGAGFRGLSETKRGRYDLVYGHFYFGLQEASPRPVRVLTMLREPGARVVSHYHGNPKRKADHYLHEAATRLNLREYLTRAHEFHPQGALEVDNFMVRIFAGENSLAVPFGAVDRSLYERARSNLQTIDVVGLLERFDESLLLMRRTLNWSRWRCLYTRRNVGAHPRVDELDDATRRALDERTAWDKLLYDDASALLASRLAALGDELPVELSKFRQELRLVETAASVMRLRD